MQREPLHFYNFVSISSKYNGYKSIFHPEVAGCIRNLSVKILDGYIYMYLTERDWTFFIIRESFIGPLMSLKRSYDIFQRKQTYKCFYNEVYLMSTSEITVEYYLLTTQLLRSLIKIFNLALPMHVCRFYYVTL